MKDTIQTLRSIYASLSNAKKTAASYIMNNYQRIPFMTVTDLAAETGVSDTTIINLCVDMGFDGYAAFRRAARDDAQALSSVPSGRPDDAELTQEDELIDGMLNAGIADITATLSNPQNRRNLLLLTERMKHVNKIYAVGFWNFGAFVQEICLQFRRIGWRATAIYPDLGDYIDKVLQITSDDLVFVVNMSRYMTGISEICLLLHERGVPIVLVTDMGPCPTHQYAAMAFCCQATEFGNGLVAADVLFNTILKLIKTYCPRETADYETLREGVFTRFNPYGVIEPPNRSKDRI